jgi:hypothetical protein
VVNSLKPSIEEGKEILIGSPHTTPRFAPVLGSISASYNIVDLRVVAEEAVMNNVHN